MKKNIFSSKLSPLDVLLSWSSQGLTSMLKCKFMPNRVKRSFKSVLCCPAEQASATCECRCLAESELSDNMLSLAETEQ